MDIKSWMDGYKAAVMKTFGNRVYFIGLQGSRGRGEAEERSDIDTVLILDTLSAEDLELYRAMLDTLPEREKICGFISGRAELENWDKGELFQFCNDTVPFYSTLEKLLESVSREDVCRAVKSGACGVYHAAVHNFVHGRDENALKAAYKSAVFVVQAEVFLRCGRFVKRQICLADYCTPTEQQIVKNYSEMKNGEKIDFRAYSETIINWASSVIQKTIS